MSKQKSIGTRFETAICKYLRAELDDERIERRALHGSQDMGDIYGVYAHTYSGIIEAKAHKTVTPALIDKWRAETLDERDNAEADFALLVIKQPNRSIKYARVDVTFFDLYRIIGYQSYLLPPQYDAFWLSLTLEEAAKAMRGDYLIAET